MTSVKSTSFCRGFYELQIRARSVAIEEEAALKLSSLVRSNGVKCGCSLRTDEATDIAGIAPKRAMRSWQFGAQVARETRSG
jgi:hypothetical protein